MNEYPAKLNTGYYRVRTDWNDDASQLGAYKLLANAKAKCDENPGSHVFAEDGTVIYPADEPTTREETAEEKPVMDLPEEDKPSDDAPGDGEEDFPSAEPQPDAVAFGKLKTLMNIRKEPSLEAEVVTVYPMNTIVEVLEVCDNWLKIKCPEAEDGIAYVLNEDDAYVFVGRDVYEVVAWDNLWRIAERKLGSGTHYTDIRELNGLTSNAIRIGMKLLLP
ncbi:LysM peptidoglycan-binding domain-containing protein [Faecalibacterium prausnitzii]|uniref:LysM peptidoglycan-binding domain-containing protein n=1 Tax=Faecalibacterium prausnitzii TaxID=853 RepID=UPI0026656908|nr:LysM peptidoglycan-binding domain-containing protein [Faecalibacterium prausnitzii]